ncbi:hypothetical protein ACFHW2_42480 [Actinomadura sp. LOL_016]|uniref:hypothetical protein n=1 Tax=unclassified Actinomadura TaxID=2626254 RepID=UPI003A7FA6F6
MVRGEQLTLEEHRLKAELLAAIALDQDDPAMAMALAQIAHLHVALAAPPGASSAHDAGAG